MNVRQGFAVHDNIGLERGISYAAEEGFDFVELDMEHAFARHQVDPAAVRRTVNEHDVEIVVHLPYRLDVASPHERVREGACRELEAAIDAAIEFGAGTGVYHADSFARTEVYDDAVLREQLERSVRRVTAYARERDFVACLENLKAPFFDAGDFPELFERTEASACLDTGHAYVSGYDTTQQAALIRDHPDRITHVHLNDTRTAEDDEHLPVGLGALDFGPLVEAMADTGREYTCTHEVYSFGTEYCGYGKSIFERFLADADERSER